MSLLDIYKERNRNEEWFENHFSLGKGKVGKMFEYTNTNFRTQSSFATQFKEFVEIEGNIRESWARQEHHQQEVDKHRVVNLIQSKLFKKGTDEIYSRTAKGLVYTDFLETDIPVNERWLINYLFLLNGYYFNSQNYIVHRVSEDLRGYLLSVDGLTEDILVDTAKNVIQTNSLQDALSKDFFYFHSFYDDSDFLISYMRASEIEKGELAEYIWKNYESENFICCLSKKYRPSGNFNHRMLMDETKVFLLTLLFIQEKDINISNIYERFSDNFSSNIASIAGSVVSEYLYSNKNIFDPIFAEILELEEVPIADDVGLVATIEDIEEPEEYIDDTSEEGKRKIRDIYNTRKRQARIQGDYRCALEVVNNCKPIYFTSKANGKNFLELHHFIPKEFRNDFSYSIEVLANYVTLCPRCHRQIHLATDRERKHLINTLFEEREDRLEIVGLKVDRNDVYEYYKIDT